MRKLFLLSLLFIFLFFTPKASAEVFTISSISDTISTSRPSASAVLSANQASADGLASIVDNNSLYLASDSATFKPDTGETISTVTVASMSAAASGVRKVYFTGNVGQTHHIGDPLVVPISAMHKLQFNTTKVVPASGKILVTFPALTANDANNAASPSASTFQMNGLNQARVMVVEGTTDITTTKITGGTGGGIAITNSSGGGSSPVVTITLNNASTINPGTLKIYLGCTGVDGSGNCNAQSPTIINPTQSSTAIGTARAWSIRVDTQDSSSTTLESGKTQAATVTSVQVQATVDQIFSLTIAGIGAGSAINTGNTNGCTNAETVSTGIDAAASLVDLGSLGSGVINISAQKLTVSTNAPSGYVLTATSSGHLINPATGIWVPDSTTPAAMTAGTSWFGFHPCGYDVYNTPASLWFTTTRNDAITAAGGAKVGWPTQSSALTLSSNSTGPIGGVDEAGGKGITSVEYAGTVASTFAAGTYTTVVTYVATPTF